MTNTNTVQYPPARKYDVNEEYADAERELSEALLDLDSVSIADNVARYPNPLFRIDLFADDAWWQRPVRDAFAAWKPVVEIERSDVYIVGHPDGLFVSFSGAFGDPVTYSVYRDGDKVYSGKDYLAARNAAVWPNEVNRDGACYIPGEFNEDVQRHHVALAMRDAADKELLSFPAWQTEPPTEAGWYPAIKEGYLVVVKVVWDKRALGGPRLTPNVPVDFDAFSHWWPIPITLPELPEDALAWRAPSL